MGPQLWIGVQIMSMMILVSMMTTIMCTPYIGTPPTPPGSSSLPWLW